MAKKILPEANELISAAGERAGAAELLALLRLVRQATNEQIGRYLGTSGGDYDGVDARDYVWLTEIVGHFIEAGVTNISPSERQGYVRGLVDLLCMFVDGCTLNIDEWDPLKASAHAFASGLSTVEASGNVGSPQPRLGGGVS